MLWNSDAMPSKWDSGRAGIVSPRTTETEDPQMFIGLGMLTSSKEDNDDDSNKAQVF